MNIVRFFVVDSIMYEEAYFIYNSVFNWLPIQFFSIICNVCSGVSAQIENYPNSIILENLESINGTIE